MKEVLVVVWSVPMQWEITDSGEFPVGALNQSPKRLWNNGVVLGHGRKEETVTLAPRCYCLFPTCPICYWEMRKVEEGGLCIVVNCNMYLDVSCGFGLLYQHEILFLFLQFFFLFFKFIYLFYFNGKKTLIFKCEWVSECVCFYLLKAFLRLAALNKVRVFVF